MKASGGEGMVWGVISCTQSNFNSPGVLFPHFLLEKTNTRCTVCHICESFLFSGEGEGGGSIVLPFLPQTPSFLLESKRTIPVTGCMVRKANFRDTFAQLRWNHVSPLVAREVRGVVRGRGSRGGMTLLKADLCTRKSCNFFTGIPTGIQKQELKKKLKKKLAFQMPAFFPTIFCNFFGRKVITFLGEKLGKTVEKKVGT